MGWLRKITGVDKQLKVQEKQAAIAQQANEQAAAANIASINAAAAATADQQAILAERAVAEKAAAAAVSQPLDVAEVSLSSDVTLGGSTKARKAKRAAFGKNYQSGISI